MSKKLPKVKRASKSARKHIRRVKQETRLTGIAPIPR